jgi:chromosomal replication initiation ATPase DnaA
MALTIPAPDEELLVQLLEEHAARRGLALGDGVLAFLLPAWSAAMPRPNPGGNNRPPQP